MGIFNSFFGNKEKVESSGNVNWIPFTSLNQIEEIKKESETNTVVIFKHSTRCGISRMVIKQFEKMFDEAMKDLKVYYLDLLSYRDISNEVGYTFQVLHQSPQVLVIKNGNAIAHDSHYSITQLNLKELTS